MYAYAGNVAGMPGISGRAAGRRLPGLYKWSGGAYGGNRARVDHRICIVVRPGCGVARAGEGKHAGSGGPDSFSTGYVFAVGRSAGRGAADTSRRSAGGFRGLEVPVDFEREGFLAD